MSQKPKEPSNYEKDWRKALLPVDSTLQQAIKSLNDSLAQIVLVISPEGILEGTITDGDIRRGLLQGMELSSPIKDIIIREPLVVPPQMARKNVLQLMQANKFHQMPVVDEKRRVIGLHLLDDLVVSNEGRSNLMLIMAGGQGTRLRPHTEKCPKPLLQVGGKPMLEHILVGAKAEGFQNFSLAVHYLGNMIEDYFGDGSRWQVKIEYLREESPLGTAGALSLLSPQPTKPFVVTNGDVLTDIAYGELLDYHCRHGALATMAVRKHEWQHPFGVVYTKGLDITGFEEKPVVRNHINAGVYVLDPEVLNWLEVGKPCDMPALFKRIIDKSGSTIVYPMHEPWLDVGREGDLDLAQEKHSPKLHD